MDSIRSKVQNQGVFRTVDHHLEFLWFGREVIKFILVDPFYLPRERVDCHFEDHHVIVIGPVCAQTFSIKGRSIVLLDDLMGVAHKILSANRKDIAVLSNNQKCIKDLRLRRIPVALEEIVEIRKLFTRAIRDISSSQMLSVLRRVVQKIRPVEGGPSVGYDRVFQFFRSEKGCSCCVLQCRSCSKIS